MTDELTPKPGRRLASDMEESLISRFRKHLAPLTHQRRDKPLWTQFHSERKDMTVLSSPNFIEYDKLFVYFEFAEEVYQCSPAEIVEFLNALEPWEDYDLYIFPIELAWCIAFTHLQLDGIHILLTGQAEFI